MTPKSMPNGAIAGHGAANGRLCHPPWSILRGPKIDRFSKPPRVAKKSMDVRLGEVRGVIFTPAVRQRLGTGSAAARRVVPGGPSWKYLGFFKCPDGQNLVCIWLYFVRILAYSGCILSYFVCILLYFGCSLSYIVWNYGCVNIIVYRVKLWLCEYYCISCEIIGEIILSYIVWNYGQSAYI